MKHINIWVDKKLTAIYLNPGHEPVEINKNGVIIGKVHVCTGHDPERIEFFFQGEI